MPNGQLTTKQYDVNNLIFAEYNPRELTKDQHQDLKDSIKRFGFVDPLIVNTNKERKNILVGGHQRLKVAKELGYENVPCVEVDLTPEKEKELNVRLNKNTGQWDWDALANHFDVGELIDWGFNEDELQFKEPEQVNGLIEDDEVPKVEESITQPGDLWILGEHRLLCGDATKKENVERLMDGQKADMVFTDPPYGISVVQNNQIGGGGAFGGKKNLKKGNKNFIKANKYNPIIGDEKYYDPTHLLGLSENYCIWGSNHFADKLPNSRGWIVWDKIDGVEGTTKNFSDIEMAWTNQDKPARIVRHRWQGLLKASEHKDKRVHPTQKPIILSIECFKLLPDALNILDPFLGSGSTLIACEKTNRKCYGMEIDTHYCDVIVKRWEEYTGNKAERIKNAD
tara:strand:- start:8309 stop:9499 length:1191 start_codon:yes stop_codon:yes gene_type:complete